MQNFLRKTMVVFFFLNVKYYYISASVYNSGADTTSRPLLVRYCSGGAAPQSRVKSRSTVICVHSNEDWT